MRIHYILHRFLIWPTFQGHRGQISIIFTMCSNSLTIGQITPNFYPAYIQWGYITYYPGFSFDLLFKVAEVKLWNFYDLLQHLTIGRIFTKFLSWIHLIRIHHILPQFLIWPTFQCHRGQALHKLLCGDIIKLTNIHKLLFQSGLIASNKIVIWIKKFISFFPPTNILPQKVCDWEDNF
jgi:hypothetical protein